MGFITFSAQKLIVFSVKEKTFTSYVDTIYHVSVNFVFPLK